jgi:hypothetical protein
VTSVILKNIIDSMQMSNRVTQAGMFVSHSAHMSTSGNPNRLHRSGAIDFNVEYAINEANRQRHKGGERNKSTPMYPVADISDSYSVVEGEPIFTPNPRKRKAAALSGERGPRPCLSSLNGICLDGFDIRKALDTSKEPMSICEDLRDAFFSQYLPSGVSVTKWSYDKAGHQANQFVATNGGNICIGCEISMSQV